MLLFYQTTENLSIANFIDSDFTFVNYDLSLLYRLEGVKGREFRKVALKDRRRGGVLGQASVLTATANGIETSPVIRGVWVMENMLGTPPTPPPPDVEPLEPDIRGATTIREQLAKHRKVATCNACHRNIDPLGFALENYSPIGGWRHRYGRKKPVIDAPQGTARLWPAFQLSLAVEWRLVAPAGHRGLRTHRHHGSAGRMLPFP